MPLQTKHKSSRALIIGNSQVGALVASIRHNTNIAVFAAPGRRFKGITIDQGGTITGAEFSLNCPETCKVTDFSRILIYADFPEPVSVVLADTQPYSSGFLNAYYKAKFQKTDAIALADKLAEFCDPSAISLIPRNLSVEDDAGGYPDIDMAQAHAEISALAGYDIAQVKGGIYSDTHAPLKAYFKQSLRIDGSMVDPVEKPMHARRHVSAEAGVILYDNILPLLGIAAPLSGKLKRLWSRFSR
ncbi:MAG: hypothetical protein WA790_19465 [Sulfitobacter sp.]